MRTLFCLLLTLIFVLPSTGFSKGDGSGVTLIPAFNFFSQETKDSSTPPIKTNSTVTGINALGGYTFPMGLFIGGKFYSRTASIKNDANTNDTKQYWSALGGTVGYFKSGFFISGTYIFSADFKTEITLPAPASTSKYSTGSGYSGDIGYFFNIGKGFYFGPFVSYISTEYKKYSLNGGAETDLTNKYTDTFIEPFIAFMGMF